LVWGHFFFFGSVFLFPLFPPFGWATAQTFFFFRWPRVFSFFVFSCEDIFSFSFFSFFLFRFVFSVFAFPPFSWATGRTFFFFVFSFSYCSVFLHTNKIRILPITSFEPRTFRSYILIAILHWRLIHSLIFM
jgi:hypothetical protein